MPERDNVWRVGSVGEPGAPTTVIEVEGLLHRLEDILAASPAEEVSTPTVRGLLADWETWRRRIDDLVPAAVNAPVVDAAEARWLPPVVFPDKLVCVGANYTDHLEEMGVDVSRRAPRPYAFLKPTTTGLIGDGAPVIAPRDVTWLDWEGELAVVIGRRTRRFAGDALDCVAGYLPLNDVSARDWMEEGTLPLGMDWILHKSFDSFSPTGRLLTPAQFVPDPQNLRIRTVVNGAVKQDSNTSRMIFDIREIISHLSSVMTLMPGDIIATGSPAGVGFARTPREHLSPGDTVSVDIERLGSVTNPIVAEAG